MAFGSRGDVAGDAARGNMRLLVALVAPVGTILLALALGDDSLFMAGMVFALLVLAAGVLRRMS